MNKLCAKIDTCHKIDMLRDKDMLDSQFAEAVRDVCGKCEDFTVGGREMLTDGQMENIAESIALSFIGEKARKAKEGDLERQIHRAIRDAQADLTRKEMVEELGDIWAELQDYLTPSVGSLLMVDRGDLTKIEIRIEALKGS